LKHLKRIAVLLFGGFIAFAPPGTLIFGAILILGLVGNFWAIVGGVLVLAALAALLLVRKNSKRGRIL
jgi:hypothetical protein